MNKSDYKGIWVFAEQENGAINPAVFELLGKAQELKAHNGEEISAVLLGAAVEELTQELITFGADKVILAEHENLANYSARPYQQALTQLAEKHRPSIILYAATTLGCDLAPRMMVSLKTGLTADAIDLSYDEDGVFCQTTPAYGGTIMAHIAIPEKRPQMATVRTKLFTPLEADPSRKGEVIRECVAVDKEEAFQVLKMEKKQAAGIPLDQAKLIVSGGRGIKNEQQLALLNELASLLNGTVASSRPLVEDGFLPHSRQIGQSGETVKPDVIFNIGISGSTQYMIGMRDAGCIISINKDKNARIFDISDYGAVADLKTLVPAVIAEVKKRLN